MTPLQYYLLGNGSWFFAWGVQSVTFAWLVTMVLHESPQMVGVAQTTLLIPAMLFMLIGGGLADRVGGRRVVIVAQGSAALAPLFLTITVVTGNLTYSSILLFAVMMGCAQAFVTPARDSLLNQVADGRVQRRVLQTSMTQFGVQMLGFVVASTADRLGAAAILLIQMGSLLSGAYIFSRLNLPVIGQNSDPDRERTGLLREMADSLVIGYRTMIRSRPMRVVLLQNCAMGVCFMGSYIVTIPLLVREVYAGSSAQLAWLNAANSLGLVLTILALLRFGDLHRQGRALLIAHSIGSFALAGAGLGLGFTWVIICIFGWGACGGVAMSMARTIMQVEAPEDQRGRMMAFFSFAFMGSGPVGAMACSFLVDRVGPENALFIAAGTMLLVIVSIARISDLWHLDAREASLTAQ